MPYIYVVITSHGQGVKFSVMFLQVHKEMFDFLLEVLVRENQPSVRAQAEWLMQLLLYKHDEQQHGYRQCLWRHLQKVQRL